MHQTLQNCPHGDQMQTGPHSCVHHSTEQLYQLAVEWSHDQQGACVGLQILRFTFRPRRMPDGVTLKLEHRGLRGSVGGR